MAPKSKLDKMYIVSIMYIMLKAPPSSPTERSPGSDLLPQLSSTELKSNTGEVLRQAAKGAIAITRHNRTEFVLLPAAQYEELVSQASSALATMSEEFDSLVARMNTPAAAKGFQSLFSATPQKLGKVAVAAVKRHAR